MSNNIELERKFILEIIQNMNIVVEKSKALDNKISKMEVVIFGDDVSNRIGLTENFRSLTAGIKDLTKLIEDKLAPEVDNVKERMAGHVTDNGKILTRLEVLEDFMLSIKSLPTKVLVLIPVVSVITQIISQVIIPLFFKK